MSNARTTSLHEQLPVELRRQVERDLIEQPPGRETYAKVYEFHKLGELDVGLKSLERYGGYLRGLARDQWIRELADHVAGTDLAPRIQATVRSKLYEALVTGETRIGDLVKAALAEKLVSESAIKGEEWAAKKQQMTAELEKIAARSGAGKGLTPEVLAEIKSKVLGI